MKRKKARGRSLGRARRRERQRATEGPEEFAEPRGILESFEKHPETGPRLTGGDLDADWVRAESSGEEAVGGSESTPDQDVVDELGRALGVEQAPDAEFVPSEEILRRRDRLRWRLEQGAEAIETAREAEEHEEEEE